MIIETKETIAILAAYFLFKHLIGIGFYYIKLSIDKNLIKKDFNKGIEDLKNVIIAQNVQNPSQYTEKSDEKDKKANYFG